MTFSLRSLLDSQTRHRPDEVALTEDGTLLVGADNLTLYAYRTL